MGDELLEEAERLFARWLTIHQAQCGHSGCREPHNALAWIAHRAGVRSIDAGALRNALADYEATCVKCSHLRN